MSWPHQKDGTVDWESVFEDENTGLTRFVEQARSTEALARCAHVIVQSLFIRADDSPFRDAFSAAIDEVVHSSDHAAARKKIAQLIHEIKLNRIERAAVYVKQRDIPEEERRLAEDEPLKPLENL